MSDIGHNSDPNGKRKEYVQRFKVLFEDLKEMQDEIRDLGAEAKAAGINPKVAKQFAKDLINPDAKRKREAYWDEFDQWTVAVVAA